MQRVTFETAKLSTEKGYRDNPWGKNYRLNPYQAELQDWLRNTYGKHISVIYTEDNFYRVSVQTPLDGKIEIDKNFHSYEQALEEGLLECMTNYS